MENKDNKNYRNQPPEKRKEGNLKYCKKGTEGIKVNENEYYTEVSNYKKEDADYGMTKHITKFIFKVPEERKISFNEAFKKIVGNLIQNAYTNTVVPEGWEIKKFSFYMMCPVLNDPINIPARSREQNTLDVILNQLLHVEQSFKEQNLLHQEFIVYVTTFAVPNEGK